MTPSPNERTIGDVSTSTSTAIARMRLARRVVDALLPQPQDVTLEAATAGEWLTSAGDNGALVPDFSMSVLDLTLQIVLLVGRGPEDFPAASVEAQRILTTNPDTEACVLVADDAALTARIVEPQYFDDATAAAGYEGMTGPLRPLIDDYLRVVNPRWPEAKSLIDDGSLDYEATSETLARMAVSERKASVARIPERQAARDALSVQDAEWAARLALRVAQGENLDVRSEIDSASGSWLAP